jgi:hypothetical protein
MHHSPQRALGIINVGLTYNLGISKIPKGLSKGGGIVSLLVEGLKDKCPIIMVLHLEIHHIKKDQNVMMARVI